MQINLSPLTGTAAPAEAGFGKKAQIKRQIRALEERKRKLLKKLAKLAGGADAGNATPAPAETASIAQQPAAAASAAPAGDNAGAAKTGAARLAFYAGQTAIRVLSAALAPESSEEEDDSQFDDPKLIFKMIMAIEMQIMTLRAQLDDQDAMADALESAQRNILEISYSERTDAMAGHVLRTVQGDEATISDAALSMAGRAAPEA